MTLADERYWITDQRPPRWRTFFVLFGAFWAGEMLIWALEGKEPAAWAAALISAAVVGLPLLCVVWIGRITSSQYVVVRPNGLLVAVPFLRLIPFEDISYVRCLSLSKPAREYWGTTFRTRRLAPDWVEAPNIEINFRTPVKLNLYPFRWFRQLVLTVDRPNEFVAALAGKVSVDTSDAGAMYTRAIGRPWSRRWWSLQDH